MGLLNSALQIGRSAITSYQSTLSVIGNNIANAADPDYTRQRAVLNPLLGAPLIQGIRPGGGVALTSLERLINEGLEARLRQAIGGRESALVTTQILSQTEQSLNELTDNDLSSLLSTLFNSFQDVQNNPSDVGLRGVTLGNAAALADAFRTRRQSSLDLIEEINQQIDVATTNANELAAQIAALNVDIVEAEAGGHVAGALRDSRDALLRELSEIVDIKVRSQESGTVSVFVGNETLIQLGSSRGLTAELAVNGEFARMEVRFADNNGQADVRGGRIAGLMEARDTFLADVIEELDQLAAGLIAVVNEIHTDGQGLEGFTSLTGTFGVSDPDTALTDVASGLDFIPQRGSFFIAVTDTSSGLTNAVEITIDETTTLNDLVTQINGNVTNVTAAVAVNNKLTLTAAPGFSFSFGHDGVAQWNDTSNVLAALGVNTFFEGKDASDIAVNATLDAQPEFLAAAQANLVGDGGNAGRLASAVEATSTVLAGASLFDFYNRFIGELGVATASAAAKFDSADGVLLALQTQRASISGVNLDEEAVDLIRYQRAFQGAARFTSIVDQLITEMLNIIR